MHATRSTRVALCNPSQPPVCSVPQAFEVRRSVTRNAGRIASTIAVGNDPIAVTIGYGALWVVNSDDGTVSVVRPGIRATKTVDATARALDIAAGEGGVWVADQGHAAVTRIDPDTLRVVDEIDGPVGGRYFGVAAGGGGVWVTDPENRTITRIDPHTNRLTATISVSGWPRGVSAAGDQIWISIGSPDD